MHYMMPMMIIGIRHHDDHDACSLLCAFFR